MPQTEFHLAYLEIATLLISIMVKPALSTRASPTGKTNGAHVR
jgi:hypothetical protein